MGHWDQIGQENAEHRERLAAMPPWRRRVERLIEALQMVLAIAGALAIGALIWHLQG